MRYKLNKFIFYLLNYGVKANLKTQVFRLVYI